MLQPRLMMDANRNRAEVPFDVWGWWPERRSWASRKKTWVIRSPGSARPHPKSSMPLSLIPPARPLRCSVTPPPRIVYDLHAYAREPDPKQKPPTFAATLSRETHVSDSLPPQGLRIQVGLAYSDGFGRVIQQKIQAERPPDPNDPHSPTVAKRWVGSGWTLFNNKGQPVRQFEPFFDDTHVSCLGVRRE